MPNVLHLFRAPQRRLPMAEVTEIRAVEDSGLEGCAHARSGSSRQVLLVDKETLEVMDLRPGNLRENVTTQGLNVNGLALGQRLRVGEAHLESAPYVLHAIRWKKSVRVSAEKCEGAGGRCAGSLPAE